MIYTDHQIKIKRDVEKMERLWRALGCPSVQSSGDVIYRYDDVDERRAHNGERVCRSDD